MLQRHKMYSIKDVVHEKSEWIERYNDFDYTYWLKRWQFLCRKLNTYSEIEKDKSRHRYYPTKNSLDKG